MLAELGTELLLNLPEVERRHALSRSSFNLGLVADDLASEWLREASDGLTEVTLEEFDDGCWEVKSFGTVQDILGGEVVRGHPLSEVANGLGGWGDFDDVSALGVSFVVS